MASENEQLDLAALQAAAGRACGLLRVLGNQDRLLLLCKLAEGEYCVSELEAMLRIQQPTLSQQLGVLREEQLVTTRREGKQIYYRIASEEAIAVMRTLYEVFCNTSNGEKK
jgi:ArsR family transcriptional regulator